MAKKPTVTREIGPLPKRPDDAHKGDAGRVLIIGGCTGDVTMIGSVALAANAAFRTGAGLVQVVVPDALQAAALTLAPCATARRLYDDAPTVLDAIAGFQADVVAIGPGLGHSLSKHVLIAVLTGFPGPIVVDADGLNLLAGTQPFDLPHPRRVVLTPHPGEMRRLLTGRGIQDPPRDRSEAACALVGAYGCTAILKGSGTVVTDGERLYVNETGNAGMGTGGTGDVLTGVVAALLGQKMETLEAAMLGVYLHGLAGDFAAEELGRLSMTASDLIDFLPEAICDYEGPELP